MKTTPGTITIPVRMDEKTFKRFARFDMFILRKKWIRPAVFFLIMTAFAFAALLIGKEQSGMIAAVLLVIGIGLPLVYAGSFLSQVNMQAVSRKLKPAREVYTVSLREEGVTVKDGRKDEETPVIPWDKVQQAFRRKGCIYRYVTAAKAFLLPAGQADATDDEVWSFLKEHMGQDKCRE